MRVPSECFQIFRVTLHLGSDTVYMTPFGLACLEWPFRMEQWHSSFSQVRTENGANILPCPPFGRCCFSPMPGCAFRGHSPAPHSAAGINLPISLISCFISGHPAAASLPELPGSGFIAFLKFQISVSEQCSSG